MRRDLDPENIHKSNCQFILIANYFPSIFVDVDDDDVATGDTSIPFHLNLSLLLHTHGLCDIVLGEQLNNSQQDIECRSKHTN